MAMQPVEAVVLGAGNRGYGTFGGYAQAFPHQMKIVGVAEPDPVRREHFVHDFHLPAERVFDSWEALLERPQLAEVLINATMDRSHFDSTWRALERGYHIFLEKPLATDPRSCLRLARRVKATGRILQLGHSLRYNAFFTSLKAVLQWPDVGEWITMMHNEHIAYWHFAHSFVRGNWGNEDRSSPGLLAKSCHDVDLLCWLTERLPARVTSFGSLTHFRSDRADSTIPARCTDGCPREAECPYSAPAMYLGDLTGWPVNTLTSDLSYAGRRKALETGPYGRCVYRCDNNVVDHQLILFEYDGGLTIGFQMHGHSHDNIRTLRVSLSRATIRGHLENRELDVHYYLDGRQELIHTGGPDDRHGGGDTLMLHDFIRLVREGRPKDVVASAEESYLSHLLVFATEAARKSGEVIDVASYRREIEDSTPLDHF